jgi:hypothetical protein
MLFVVKIALLVVMGWSAWSAGCNASAVAELRRKRWLNEQEQEKMTMHTWYVLGALACGSALALAVALL